MFMCRVQRRRRSDDSPHQMWKHGHVVKVDAKQSCCCHENSENQASVSRDQFAYDGAFSLVVFQSHDICRLEQSDRLRSAVVYCEESWFSLHDAQLTLECPITLQLVTTFCQKIATSPWGIGSPSNTRYLGPT